MAKNPKAAAKLAVLSEAERYRLFVEEAADQQTAWSVGQDGWLSLGDDTGREALPVWPTAETAEAWKNENFPDAEVMPLDVNFLLDDMLPAIRAEGGYVVVFPTASDGVWAQPDQLEADLRQELDLLG